jgi:hypothetical protein
VSTLDDYRKTLEQIGGGTVSVEFVRAVLEAADAEIEARSGEFTVTQAVEISGRSRSWFERRLRGMERDGLARQLAPHGVWLLKGAAIPSRGSVTRGFDPRLDENTIADRLVAA